MKKYFVILFLFFVSTHAQDHINFIESMMPNQEFKAELLCANVDWALVKNLYEEYMYSREYSEIPKIPKIIHQIWLGSPFPQSCIAFQKSWKYHHPDWEYILWNDREVEAFILEKGGIEYYAKYVATENYGERSDIARYLILREIGGLYIDTDFECLKPFDYLHHTLEFYTGIALDRKAILFNGLIGSRPHHPILEECVRSLRGKTPGASSRSEDIMERTGPYYLTHIFFKCIEGLKNVVAFPNTFFYPLPNHAKHNIDRIPEWIKSESYAIHYWHTSWCKDLK